jgi:phage recombination protein Bet
MSTALQCSTTSAMMIWDDSKKLEEIRQIFAPKLNTAEFDAFVGMGKASGLNPFLREIWAVKYQDNAPAQIFVGRDGYRKAAQRHYEYDFHECDAVYSNDKFKRNSITGEIAHEYNLKDRGELLGAYCIVKRKSSVRPSYTWVKLSEYSTGKSLWNPQTGKPETMIKKVAECQGLRAAFQDLLGGTYSDGEADSMQQPPVVENKYSKSKVLMEKLKAAKEQVIDVDCTIEEDSETGEIANPQQMKELHALIAVKGFANGRMQKAMEYYDVETLGELTVEQANDFISRLNKEEDK